MDNRPFVTQGQPRGINVVWASTVNHLCILPSCIIMHAQASHSHLPTTMSRPQIPPLDPNNATSRRLSDIDASTTYVQLV